MRWLLKGCAKLETFLAIARTDNFAEALFQPSTNPKRCLTSKTDLPPGLLLMQL